MCCSEKLMVASTDNLLPAQEACQNLNVMCVGTCWPVMTHGCMQDSSNVAGMY
jgi:hypothetical protein